MIDLSRETLLRLPQATALVPPSRGGKRTHPSTLLRWILRGCKGPDGRTVRLDGLRQGRQWTTSREALQRFFEALTPSFDDDPPDSAPVTPTARRRALERAERELTALGI